MKEIKRMLTDPTDVQMRDLYAEEEGAILAMYDLPEGLNSFELAGAQRNALRHANQLGLLILAALSGGGGMSPLETFKLAVKGAGWEREDIENFLAARR